MNVETIEIAKQNKSGENYSGVVVKQLQDLIVRYNFNHLISSFDLISLIIENDNFEFDEDFEELPEKNTFEESLEAMKEPILIGRLIFNDKDKLFVILDPYYRDDYSFITFKVNKEEKSDFNHFKFDI